MIFLSAAENGTLEGIEGVFHSIAVGIEALGVGVLAIGLLIAVVQYLINALNKEMAEVSYERFRQGLAKALLLALEILIAADIIFTITGDLSFENVGILGLIIVIRTFLGWSLELEITGRWPWHKHKATESEGSDG